MRIFLIFLLIIAANAARERSTSKPKTLISDDLRANNVKARLEHPHGAPLKIAQFDGDNGVIIDYDNIESLYHPNLAGRKVVVYSIVGEFRKGKSFVMDYALRYLYAHYKSINYTDNPLNNKAGWMGDPDEPLKGFSWDGGKDALTKGVIIWSDIFLHEDENGVKYAIIIVDTQGMFDNESQKVDSMRIFALNALLSSFLTFNVGGQVAENQLDYLQLATNYANLVNEMNNNGTINSQTKPFQEFLFLIRDWSYYNHECGLEGGNNYVDELLETEDKNGERKRPVELDLVRRYIDETFDSVYGFLMPHPGRNVTSNKDFHGQHSMIPDDFKTHLKELIEWMFAPEQMEVKRVFGQQLDMETYLEYLKTYCKTFKSTELPPVESLYQITIKQQLTMYKDECFKQYKFNISGLAHPDIVSSVNFLEIIEKEHKLAEKSSLELYELKPKLGNKNDSDEFRDLLLKEIKNFYLDFTTSVKGNHEKFLEYHQKMSNITLEKQKIEEQINIETKRFNETMENLVHKTQVMSENFNKTIENLQKEKENSIKNLTKVFEEQQLYSTLKLSEMQSNFTRDLEEQKKKFKEEEEMARNKFKDDINKLQEALSEMEEQRKKDNKTLTAQHQANLDAFKKSQQALTKSHNENLNALKDELKKQELKYKKDREDHLVSIQKERDEAERKLREMQEQQLRVQEQHNKQMELLQQNHREQMAYIKAKSGSVNLKVANGLLIFIVLFNLIIFKKK